MTITKITMIKMMIKMKKTMIKMMIKKMIMMLIEMIIVMVIKMVNMNRDYDQDADHHCHYGTLCLQLPSLLLITSMSIEQKSCCELKVQSKRF